MGRETEEDAGGKERKEMRNLSPFLTVFISRTGGDCSSTARSTATTTLNVQDRRWESEGEREEREQDMK